jgi:hypothetical protein
VLQEHTHQQQVMQYAVIAQLVTTVQQQQQPLVQPVLLEHSVRRLPQYARIVQLARMLLVRSLQYAHFVQLGNILLQQDSLHALHAQLEHIKLILVKQFAYHALPAPMFQQLAQPRHQVVQTAWLVHIAMPVHQHAQHAQQVLSQLQQVPPPVTRVLQVSIQAQQA